MKYKRKPIEAVQWFKHGDHPRVLSPRKSDDQTGICPECKQSYGKHGWLTERHITYQVCPGDYIMKTTSGAMAYSKRVFESEYEPA